MFWKVRAMPFSAMRLGFSPVMFCAFSEIMPLVGLYTPVIMLKAVVLPAPFGPISATISLFPMVMLRLLTAIRPPNCIVA